MWWFLRHPDLFEDTYKIDDLFNLNDYSERIWWKIQAMENKWIFWFVWPYGCGKSTIIHNIKSIHSLETDPIWVHFDAWKYHDKKDLWEWFILDIGMQLYASREEIVKIIDWKNVTFTDWLLTTLSVVPWLSWLDSLKWIFESKWITRVFEFQELLSKFILWNKRDIIITIEDIDRAGEQWLIFLETLNFFIKQELEEKSIKIIALIWDKSYNDPNAKDSYLKSLDITEFISLQALDFENFVETHFNSWIFPLPSLQSIVKKQIIALCWELLKSTLGNQSFSLRQLKHILRAANNSYTLLTNMGFSADYRISIIIEVSKYIITRSSQTEFESAQTVIVWDSLLFRFLKMIIFDLSTFIELEACLNDWRRLKIQSNIWWINTEFFSPDPGKVIMFDPTTSNLAIPRFYIDFK